MNSDGQDLRARKPCSVMAWWPQRLSRGTSSLLHIHRQGHETTPILALAPWNRGGTEDFLVLLLHWLRKKSRRLGRFRCGIRAKAIMPRCASQKSLVLRGKDY